jgi:hypothetical protein
VITTVSPRSTFVEDPGEVGLGFGRFDLAHGRPRLVPSTDLSPHPGRYNPGADTGGRLAYRAVAPSPKRPSNAASGG